MSESEISMTPRSPLEDFSASTSWVIGTAVVAGFGEFALLQRLDPEPYLATDVFFFPVVGLTAAAVGLTHLLLGLLLFFYARLRPGFRVSAAVAAASVPLIGGLAYLDFQDLILPGLVSGHEHPILGLLQALVSLGILFTLALVMTRGVWLKSRGLAALVVSVSVVLVLLIGVAMRRNLIALHLTQVVLLLLPFILAGAIYRVLARRKFRSLHLAGRCVLAMAILFSFGVLGWYEGHTEGAKLSWRVLVPGGWIAAMGVILVRPPSRISVAMPLFAGVLIFGIPAWQYFHPFARGSVRLGDHLLLVTVDTLRRDALSAYSSTPPPTPRLDQFILGNTRFEQAWAPASWTLPSIASFLTGLSPRAHGALSKQSVVAEGLTLVAEELREEGYSTRGLVHNGWLHPDRGFGQGFDAYTFLPVFEPRLTLGYRLLMRLAPERYDLERNGAIMCELAAREFIRFRHEKRFMWIHLLDPHAPYDPVDSFWPADIPKDEALTHQDWKLGPTGNVNRDHIRRLYLAEVEQLDRDFGSLVDRLKAAGLYEDMAIVFTSDHGEEFWEKGRWGHGHIPLETLARMPFAVKLPGPEASREISTPVSTRVIRPLLAQLAKEIPGEPEERQNFWNALTDDSGLGGHELPFVVSVPREDTYTEAIVFGDAPYKYIHDSVDASEWLFDLGRDAGESNSLHGTHEDLLKLGREAYQGAVERAEELSAGISSEGSYEMSDEVIDQLKDLGYL